MRVTFWVGRRLFGLGRIFVNDSPLLMRKALLHPGALHGFGLGCWGIVVINFKANRLDRA